MRTALRSGRSSHACLAPLCVPMELFAATGMPSCVYATSGAPHTLAVASKLEERRPDPSGATESEQTEALCMVPLVVGGFPSVAISLRLSGVYESATQITALSHPV